MNETDIELEASRTRAFRRRLIFAFCAIGAIMLVAFGYVYFVDGPPPDDADLMVRDPQVPEAENGLTALRRWTTPPNFENFARNHGVDEGEAREIYSGQKQNDVLVDEFLAEAQPGFVQLDKILAMPKFAFNDPISISTRIPEISRIMVLMHALRLAARREQARGDYASAVRDVLRLRLLAARYAEGHMPLIQNITAMAVQGAATSAAIRLLNDPALPADARDALAAGWQPYAWPEALRRSIYAEYQFGANGIHEIKSHGIPFVGSSTKTSDQMLEGWIRLTLQPNNTFRMLGALDRAWLKALQGPYSKIDFTAIDQSWRAGQPTSGILYYVAPNFGGRYLMGTVFGSGASVAEMAYRASTTSELTRAALALRHYYDDHHALPASLDDLVPQYVPAVPLDPFNDKPLLYDPKSATIYSVGKSLKDSGGSSKAVDPDPNSPDPYNDLLIDPEQPTLDLRFQNPPAPMKSVGSTSP